MTFPTEMKMDRKAKHNKIAEMIDQAEDILISGHHDPDGDSLGTMLALRRYIKSRGKNVTAVRDGNIPYKYSFMPDIDQVRDIRSFDSKDKFDLVILLECSSPNRAGELSGYFAEDAKVVNIDHHPDNDLYGDVVIQDTVASSVGEMLYEFLTDNKYSIDKAMAIQLYTAILTDTGRFRFSSTTKRTMEAAGYLIDLGADPRDICDKVYYSMKPSSLKLTGQVLSDMDYFEDGRICLMYLTQNKVDESGAGWDDVEGLADFAMFGENTQVGLISMLDRHIPTDGGMIMPGRVLEEIKKILS